MTSPPDEMSERLVDALNATYGTHIGHRAAHAKGVLCGGMFTASPDAARISRAEHLQGEPHRVHLRFSNGSGDPSAPDTARDGRGVALKVYLHGGGTTDIVGLSLPLFFVRTPEDLIAFNNARRPDPATGALDMEKVGAFLAEHPETIPAVTAAISALPPVSYAQMTYHSMHAYRFIAADGTVRHGRYHLVPAAGEATISDEEAAARGPDYLRVEIEERFNNGPVLFALVLELAGPDDPVDDPTAAWPEERERVELGTVELSTLAHDREHDGDILVFDPTRVVDGIELTDDAILHARPGAYSVSVARRTAVTGG